MRTIFLCKKKMQTILDTFRFRSKNLEVRSLALLTLSLIIIMNL